MLLHTNMQIQLPGMCYDWRATWRSFKFRRTFEWTFEENQTSHIISKDTDQRAEKNVTFECVSQTFLLYICERIFEFSNMTSTTPSPPFSTFRVLPFPLTDEQTLQRQSWSPEHQDTACGPAERWGKLEPSDASLLSLSNPITSRPQGKGPAGPACQGTKQTSKMDRWSRGFITSDSFPAEQFPYLIEIEIRSWSAKNGKNIYLQMNHQFEVLLFLPLSFEEAFPDSAFFKYKSDLWLK